MLGQALAVCAGICAAMASVCAKLAMAGDSTYGLCMDWVGNKPLCDAVVMYVRVLFFSLIFLFNALMWTLFVKSLRKCSSSLEATVTNTAANFFTSALIGCVLFGEALSLVWCGGASLIVLGLLLIHRGSGEDPGLESDVDIKQKDE